MTHNCQGNSGGYSRRSANNFEATAMYNGGSVLTCNAKLTWLSVRHLGFIRPRRRAYFSARMKYYPNTVASLRLARLIIAGDISPNPGPKHAEAGTIKCNNCSRKIAVNHRAIRCESCRMWFHIKCGGVTAKEFTLLQTGGTRSWDCKKCIFNSLPNVISPRSTYYSSDSDDTGPLTPTRESAEKTRYKIL